MSLCPSDRQGADLKQVRAYLREVYTSPALSRISITPNLMMIPMSGFQVRCVQSTVYISFKDDQLSFLNWTCMKRYQLTSENK